MTLSNAILNYPWDGVPLVAVDPNKPGDIYMVKREIQIGRASCRERV